MPNADCKAYVNLTAEGTSGDTNTQQPSSLAPTTITTGVPSEQVPTESPSPSPPAAADPKDDKSLSPGGIAGVAVGGAAVLVALLALFIWWKKRGTKSGVPASVGPSTTTAVSEWANDPKNPTSPYAISEAGGGASYFNGPSQGYSTPPPGSPGWGPGGVGASGIGGGGYGSMNQGYGGGQIGRAHV